jgi:carboxymethylenebutenolidase
LFFSSPALPDIRMGGHQKYAIGDIMTEDVTESTFVLNAADGFKLEAFRAAPSGQARGGLVILQEIFGVTDQLKDVARSYACDGYDAVVPALFDRVAPGTVVPFSDPTRGRDLAYGLDLDKVMLDIAAAAGAVRSTHGVSVLGYCWGGGVIVRAGAEIELSGAIAFYGTRLQSYLDCKPKCPLLFHFGSTDPNSPPETIEAVRRAFTAAETYEYGAGHGFANEVRPSYVPEAARAARARTLDFLGRVYG